MFEQYDKKVIEESNKLISEPTPRTIKELMVYNSKLWNQQNKVCKEIQQITLDAESTTQWCQLKDHELLSTNESLRARSDEIWKCYHEIIDRNIKNAEELIRQQEGKN